MRQRTLSDVLREVNVAPQMQDTLARIVKNLGGGRMPMVFSTTSLGNIAAAAETAICTTPPLNPGIDAAVILLFGFLNITIGTNGTALTTQFRRGSGVAGLAVGRFTTFTTVAGNVTPALLVDIDSPGAVAGQQYTFTAQVTAASAGSIIGSTIAIAIAVG